jgi:hypothetical protein
MMVLPIPIGDKGVFSKDAVGFDDFAVSEMSSVSEFTPELLKKIWLMTLISLEQKNIGTPALCKRSFLTKKRWADYDKWVYPMKSRSFHCMNKEAFASNSIHGTVVYDDDVARHYKFLFEETRHLPCTPIPKAGQAPFVPAEPDPIPPSPKKPDSISCHFKYHAILQPCRSKTNPDELAGFLFWLLIEDCNFNLDAARCNYINALKTYKSDIESKKGGFPKSCPLSRDIMNPINEMKADDKTMLSITHRDWEQWCAMYDLAIKTCQMDEEEEGGGGEEEEMELSSDEEGEEEDEEKKLLAGYEDELNEPSYDSPYSFFTTFTMAKALLLASHYDMDAFHAAECIFDDQTGTGADDGDTLRVYLKPSASTDSTTEPSAISAKYLHPFDNHYYMTQDYFYWANSKNGSGLKYNTFPWSNNDSNPIYKNVVLDLPKKYAHKNAHRGFCSSAAAIRNVERGSRNVSLLDSSSSSRRNVDGSSSLKRRRHSQSDERLFPPSSSSNSGSENVANESGTDTSLSSVDSERRKRRKRDKIKKERSYIPTDSIQQMASSKGLNPQNISINGCKIFEDPEAPSPDGKDYVTFRFSKLAEKDDVHKVVEIHQNWKSSIHRYSEIANIDSQKPDHVRDSEAWVKERKAVVLGDYIVYEPSSFVQKYNFALESYEKAACESLFRVFKKGGESILTASVNRLIIYYFENIHNNANDLAFKLHCEQSNFEESLFAAHVKKQSLDLRYACEIISNFKEFLTIIYGVLDVYRLGDDTHFNYIGSGEGGVGKSFLLELLKVLLVTETVRTYYMGSEKCEFTDLSRSDDIITADELPPNMAGRQAGNNDRHGHTMDSSVNATKTAMSTGKSVYEVFEFLDFGDGETGRINRKIETPCVSCRVVVTNNQVILDKALRDRCHKASFVNHMAANFETDQDLLGDLHPTDMYQELSVLDIKTQIKSSDDTAFRLVRLGYSVFQTLHMIVEKMIGVGALPAIDLTLGNLIFNKVSKYIKSRTDINIAMRSHGRVVNQMRTMIITDGLNQLYFSCCRDRDIINEKTLLCLKPYLFCQVHHAVFALTLLMDQIFDPYFNCVLFAAINECGNFPVRKWVTRRSEKRTIDRTAVAARSASRNGTPQNVPVAVAAVDDEENVDDADDENAHPDRQHLEPELLSDILKDFYIADFIDNDQCTIQWRIINPEGRGNGINGGDQTKLVNLNYVHLKTSELNMINSLIADHMSPRLGNSDVGALLMQMKNTRIKVSGAPKPISHDNLMNPNFTGKLPCYEDKHEFTVLEQCVSNTGGKSYDWYFCMHILTDLNNGESLIMDALRSISYVNFRCRPSLLTGFVKSYQGATLRSEPIEPNPDVSCFVAKNASYREEWVRKKLAFNETLLSHQQGNPISLEEAIRLQDPIYKTPEIKIYNDLDDWAAEEWAKKSGMPVAWVRKIRKRDVDTTSANKEVNTGRSDFKLSELELKWQFLRTDGKIELRDLPTEYSQRVRNLHWIKKDAIPGIRQITEQNFPPHQLEWSDLDKDFKVKIFQQEL